MPLSRLSRLLIPTVFVTKLTNRHRRTAAAARDMNCCSYSLHPTPKPAAHGQWRSHSLPHHQGVAAHGNLCCYSLLSSQPIPATLVSLCRYSLLSSQGQWCSRADRAPPQHWPQAGSHSHAHRQCRHCPWRLAMAWKCVLLQPPQHPGPAAQGHWCSRADRAPPQHWPWAGSHSHAHRQHRHCPRWLAMACSGEIFNF